MDETRGSLINELSEFSSLESLELAEVRSLQGSDEKCDGDKALNFRLEGPVPAVLEPFAFSLANLNRVRIYMSPAVRRGTHTHQDRHAPCRGRARPPGGDRIHAHICKRVRVPQWTTAPGMEHYRA